MGTDIHLIVQQKNAQGGWDRIAPPQSLIDKRCVVGNWDYDQYLKAKEEEEEAGKADLGWRSYYYREIFEEWYSGRNYHLFSILADVRNGFGFAGIRTGEGYVPISKPKGFPDDFDVKEVEGDYGGGWLGDHSFSWLTLRELLEYDWNQTTTCCGVITLAAFVDRKAKGETGSPDTYSGGVGGPGVVVYEELEVDSILSSQGHVVTAVEEASYVRIHWQEKYSESAGRFFTEVIPALQEVEPNPDNIRLVFGFDS
jgi:hypothetical protein